MNILIVGLGSIGNSKAKTYANLGHTVYYFDVSSKKTSYNQFREDQAGKIDFEIIDITSPTYLHIEHLEKFYQYYPDSLFVVEKPLCGTQHELDRFKYFFSKNPKLKLLYSENIVFSTIFNEIERLLEDRGLEINSIYIEFAKDRREDIRNGRTVDLELESFGIDIPHILTIIEKLGLDISKISSLKTEDMSIGDSNYPRQGRISLVGNSKNGKNFSVMQSLDGKYTFHKPYFVLPAESSILSYRVIYIDCGENKGIAVHLEPIPGLSRFTSRIMYVEGDKVIESIDVQDQNLAGLIEHVVNVWEETEDLNEFVTVKYAINMMELLLQLRNAAITGKQYMLFRHNA